MTSKKHPFGIYIPRIDEDRRDWKIGILVFALLVLCAIIVGFLENPNLPTG